jgi:hypothetical protein
MFIYLIFAATYSVGAPSFKTFVIGLDFSSPMYQIVK